jgi:nuclear transport factor 2 (NTF2) superfamily protein
VIDARWATGQTMNNNRAFMFAWESQQGFQDFHRRSDDGDWEFDRTQMFDARYTSSYSRPIEVEQVWLDALTPAMPEASRSGNELVMNSFEALLNQSGFRDIEDLTAPVALE